MRANMNRFLIIAGLILLLPIPAFAGSQTVIDITFPVEGEATFQDDFDDARSGGRTHGATDIMASKMQRIFAVVDGEISYAPETEPSYGYMITLEGDDGYIYNYVHLNNDTPGTDDGQGGVENAYAPGIERGVRVTRGQHIAYVGDSGNAESVGSHLHFEIEDGDGNRINPYPYLISAKSSLDYSPTAEREGTTTINEDKGLVAVDGALCESGSLIRTPTVSTVYYCGADGGRYAFPNESIFFSWYSDFSTVKTVSTETMGEIPLEGSVTYRPGAYMIKIQSVPNVYVVSRGGVLRHVPTEEMAKILYGDSWAKQVRDIPDSLFPRYEIQNAVTWD